MCVFHERTSSTGLRGGNLQTGYVYVVSPCIRLCRAFLSLSNRRQMFRVSIDCCSAWFDAAEPTIPCRREPPNSKSRHVLASVLTAPFFLCPLSAPFVFSRFMFDDVSKVTLPAWPGQGYERHWLFSRTLSPIWFLSVVGRYIVFQVIGSL